MDFVSKICRGDQKIWMIFFLLLCLSIVAVFSASSTLTFNKNYWEPITKHVMFLLFGSAIVLFASSLKPKVFTLTLIGLPCAWALLIAVKAMGSSVNGAERYIFGFQPSEFAKFFLVGSVAFFLSRYKKTNREIFYKITVWISIITCGFIFIDNFSTAVLIFGVIIMMLCIARIPFKKLVKLIWWCGLFAGLFVVLTFVIPENVWEKTPLNRAVTVKYRVGRFLHIIDIDESSKKDANFQELQAKIAIANSKFIGKGPGNGIGRNVLPQAFSDFIYAIIIEEYGMLGGIAVLGLYVWLFIQAGLIARQCESLFPKLLVMGSALMLTVQAMANMAVAVGLIPVTGQPLPLLSKGGSSILVTCAFIGVILSVSHFNTLKGVKRDDEIGEEMAEQMQMSLAAEEARTAENYSEFEEN
ncbi:MAG: FtsW/RodA/SpoVE family cell cycle protein [Dysgonamonadaceae bacterium]|jgi:cell division protein FtsW|nr:FtsW/RodA/SpoVE family cell cycle protein [Dysgonamonadaceae bacterium]